MTDKSGEVWPHRFSFQLLQSIQVPLKKVADEVRTEVKKRIEKAVNTICGHFRKVCKRL